LPTAVIETLTSLAFAIDAKDHYTQGHSQKVSTYAQLLAQAVAKGEVNGMELDESQVEEIRLAGLMHDMGKVGIPEALLNKAGPLDADEWEVMKTHAPLGAKLLEPLVRIRAAAAIQGAIRHHHEFYDGSGYPDGLAGEEIPPGARIVTIADAYDTITSDRTYKKAHSADEAFSELERCAGTQFDPLLVRGFVETMRRQPRPIAEVGVAVDPSPSTPPN
jgi:putative two-component system response regulator